MTIHEIESQALKLSVSDRQHLIKALQRLLQPEETPSAKSKGLATNFIGIAKTDTPPPTDAEVKAMLDERLAQKYL